MSAKSEKAINKPKPSSELDDSAMPHDDWEAAHNAKYEKLTERLSGDLLNNWVVSSNDERYPLLKTYSRERHKLLHEHMNGGDPVLSAVISFSALSDLAKSTNSVYLLRYIDWLQNREVHGGLETWLSMSVDVDKDSPTFDSEKYEQYLDYCDWLSDYPPVGLPFKYKEEAQDYVNSFPEEYKDFFDRGLEMMSNYPKYAGLYNDSAPSPFGEMLRRIDGLNLIPKSEVELSAETAYLFGIKNIGDISVDSRRALYHTGVNLDKRSYDRIRNLVKNLSDEDRKKVAESFLATEFGDDLGEQILVYAENKKGSTLEALPYITEVLRSVRKFTNEGTFGQVDPELADDIRRGISTRTAEILFALNQRIERDKDTSKPETALKKLLEWSRGVAQMLEAGVPEKIQQTGDTRLYHFIDPETGEKYPGTLELTAFGKFAEEASLRERYVKEGRGARISLTYDEAEPEKATSTSGEIRRQAMNGRLDKSVYNIETNSSEPNAEHAEVSFDIASQHAPVGSASRVVAATISEGSAIRDTGHVNKGGASNFTYDIVDQKHGNRGIFASYVEKLGEIVDTRQKVARQKSIGKRIVGLAA